MPPTRTDRPGEAQARAVPQPPRRYHIETWGCQMNEHDSEKLAGVLEARGYSRAPSRDEADVVLLNTCSIRERAEEKLFSELGRIREAREQRPGMRIGVCGCVAQQEGERIFERAPYVDFVLGPRATASLPAFLEPVSIERAEPSRVDRAYRDDSIRFPFRDIRRSTSAGKAWVTVVEGCNHRCTYCIVPTTRGREIGRQLEDVLAEVRHLAAGGVREVEFLGQTVNAYRDTAGHTLGDLLRRAAEVPGIERLRFTTSHPAQMTDRLIDSMAAARPKVCPYLHLPVQSGSSRVLAAMRRGYDAATYLDRIARLRRAIPELALGTDVIVGFPTEEPSDFEATLALLEQVRFDTVYSFAYSPRPGTASLELGDPVPAHVKSERLHVLQELQRGIQEQRASAWVGQEVEVLVEELDRRHGTRWTGRTPHNRIVHFAGDARPGELRRVRVTSATPFSLRGEPC